MMWSEGSSAFGSGPCTLSLCGSVRTPTHLLTKRTNVADGVNGRGVPKHQRASCRGIEGL